MYDFPTDENLCKYRVSKFPILFLPSIKQLCLCKFSPSGTVLFLNSRQINSQGQLNVLPALFMF